MTDRSRVRIVEVGPRDGLQNEQRVLTLGDRIALVERLAETGINSIEVGSFVSPKWVPQMADSGEVLRGLSERRGVRYPVLVPNMHGMREAIDAGARDISLFVAASETFALKNTNCSIDESFERARPIADLAQAQGIRVRGYISCVLGCPYEGEISLGAVASAAERLIELGCHEISLGDTIGVGTPGRARKMVETVKTVVPIERMAIHFHDTYGQALANVLACLETGISVIDSSVGGLGGCPYASGASGNVATEDLVYMLDGLGIATGVELDKLLDVAAFVEEGLMIPIRSRVFSAQRSRKRPFSSAC